MSWIDGARARVALLVSRRASDSRFSEEIGFHIEMETERLCREEGLDAGEARRRALIAFGGVEHHKEALRDGRGLRWLGGLRLDLKLGLRMLAKSPGLTLVGVLGMSVAVTICTVAFGMIDAMVGQPIPLHEGERVVMIENWDRRSSNERPRTHLHDMGVWRTSLKAVGETGAYRMVTRNLIAPGARPEPVQIAEMTASAFRIARVAPLMGRHLLDEDERPGAPAVVVIAHETWQTRFGSARDIVGRTIQLGATPHTVVGVMPPGFAFPVNNRIWTALRLDPLAYAPGNAPPIKVFGRLADDASLRDAELQLKSIGERSVETRPEPLREVRPHILPYGRAFAENPGMTWLMHLVKVAITMLLVVIGINVATLVYARTASRMGEIAVRTALGASRMRIIAQLFAEALVLSAISTAIGMFAALVLLRYLEAAALRMAGDRLPYWMDFGISVSMVLYVSGLALLAAALVGAIPALKATGRGVRANLQQLGAGGGGLRLGKAWSALIVAQVAVAVAIFPVVVHVTIVRQQGDGVQGPQFSTSDWVTASLHLDRDGVVNENASMDSASAARYATRSAELVRRLKGEAGFAEVVLLSAIPGNESKLSVEAERAAVPAAGAADRAATEFPTVGTAWVDPEFFRAFGIPVLTGRAFGPGDGTSASRPVVVNQPFVRTVLGGGNALGRRVRLAPSEAASDADGAGSREWYEIVGVVPDFPTAKQGSSTGHPVMYQPMPTNWAQAVIVAARVKGALPGSFAGRLREVAVSVDPMLRMENIRAMDDTADLEGVMDGLMLWGVIMVTLSVVLLSAAGIYALMSFTIAQRRREIGIRAALGAGSRQVVSGVLSRATRQIGVGIALGVVMAGAMIQGIDGWTWEIRSMLSLAAVAAIMAAVGIIAAWGPTLAALRIQPTEALRAE